MYTLVTEIPDARLPELMSVLANAWWTKDRTLDGVKVMLANSEALVGVIHEPTDTLIAFGRAISDRIYKALIMDVIVSEAHRSRGVSKILMDGIMSHPALKNVGQLELYCKPELVDLYKRWGFAVSPSGVIFMRASRAPA